MVAEASQPLLAWLDADPRFSQPTSTLADCVLRCIEEMTPAERELMEAYYLDRDRDVLAARLKVTPNALRIRVFRAKVRLRECLRDCPGTEWALETSGAPASLRDWKGVR